MQRGGRRWSFLTLGSIDKVEVIVYCEFFCLFAAFLVSSCWLPSESSLSTAALFFHQLGKLQHRPVIARSQKVQTLELWFLCQQTWVTKNSCRHGWYFCIVYWETPRGWAFPWLWEKKKRKAFSGLMKKSPLFLSCSLYAVYATQSTGSCYLCINCVSQDISPKPTPYFQIISLPLWARAS